MNRLIIPVENQNGLNSNLAEHFGRAPYFAVVDLAEDGEVSNFKIVANVGEHTGGVGQAHDYILELRPNAIIVYGMGPRGLNTFQNANVAVLKTNAFLVNEVITAYKESKLQELTDGCEHAHHLEHKNHN